MSGGRSNDGTEKAQSGLPVSRAASRQTKSYELPSITELARGASDSFTTDAKSVAPVTEPSIIKPQLPPELENNTVFSGDQATHLVRHGFELRNPYIKLVASLEGLPIICISAFGADTNAFGKTIKYDHQDFSSSLSSADIVKYGASLPNEFVLAAAIVTKRLAGPDAMLMSRVTLWAQDTMPSSGKPPTSKLKTGKGGISGGVIPVDLSTTTKESPDGTLIALPQNANHRPSADEKSITTVQWAKPLEQVILGLDKNPPDFKMLSSNDDIKKNGYIEFQMNCADDANINQSIYRMDLRQESRAEQAKDTVKPIKIKELVAHQPSWWSADFGDFNKKAREGFHVEYKPSDAAVFKPYEVYAEIDEKGNKLPLTGDQDILGAPRSSVYDLGSLAENVIDTHADGGIEELIDGMKAVHQAVLMQDLKEGRIEPENLQENMDNFYQFIGSAHAYVEALGTITPYEAYYIIQLNNQIANLKAEYKDNPERLNALVSQINVDVSLGLTHLKTIDIDLNKAWYVEKPTEMSLRVEANLAQNFYVSPDILELHVAHEADQYIGNHLADGNDLLASMKSNIMSLVGEHQTDWKVYAKIETKEHPPTLPGEEMPKPPYYKWTEVSKDKPINPDNITELMVRAKSENQTACIHITNDGAKSSVHKDRLADIVPVMNAAVENIRSLSNG